ncbi:MAG: FG-GAP-like repeat-containing protein, partial [Flavobacteriales bacterium]|nr:FG-GAP-like repeat-containing protein [Flavobacteriales bacterium]
MKTSKIRKVFVTCIALSNYYFITSQNFKEHIIDQGDDNFSSQIIQGDIDGDGDIDLITMRSDINVSHTPYNIRLYENVGSDSYKRHVLLDRPATQATLADLDGDGDLEIVAALRPEDKIVYYDNLGGLSFSSAKTIDPFCLEAYHVIAGDFDGDNDMDIVCSSIDGLNEVTVHFNDGNGNFSGERLLDYPIKTPIEFIVGDVNNDGIDDFSYRKANDNDILLYEGTNTGNFNLHAYNGSSSVPITTFCYTDQEQDGILELAFLDDNGIYIIRQLLASTTMVQITNANNYDHIASGDIDNDGDDDLVLNSIGGTTGYYVNDLSNGYLEFSGINSAIEAGTDIIAGDYNQDGLDEIAFVGGSFTFTGISKFEVNSGTLNFDTTFAIGVPDGAPVSGDSKLLADIDSDGDLDVITYQGWYENDGTGNYSTYQPIAFPDTLFNGLTTTHDKIIKVVDIDTNGINDIVVKLAGSDQTVWLNYNNNLASVPNLENRMPTNNIVGASFIDFDLDGDLDLLGDDGSYLKWSENGYNNFGSTTIGKFNPVSAFVRDQNNSLIQGFFHLDMLADIDNDGDLDAFSKSGNAISYFENIGGTKMTQNQFLINSNSANSLSLLGTGDFNNDGFVDLLESLSGTLAYYANDGSSGFTGPYFIDNIAKSYSNRPYAKWGDIDGDNDIDIILTFYEGNQYNTITGWYENDGTGSFAPLQKIYAPEITSFSDIDDIDGDGDLDVLAYSRLSGKTSWLENLGNSCVSCSLNIDEEICRGGFTVLGSEIIFEEGTYIDTLVSQLGCDSIVQLNVSFSPNFCSTSQCSELIISEYIEGTGNNQAIELYNPTNDSIMLSDYAIGVFNGSFSVVDSIINLGGYIYSDSTFVIVNSNSNNSGMLGAASLISSKLNFTGNDAIVLYKNGSIIDRVGGEILNNNIITEGMLSTQNQTLVRLPSVTEGLIPPLTDSLTHQFSALPTDDITNLHIHVSECQQLLCNNHIIIDSTICTGDTLYTGQNEFFETGVYFDSLMNNNSCDSIVEIRLHVNSNYHFIYDTICNGDTLFYNQDTLTQNGTYNYSFPVSSECDSLVVFNLTVLTPNASINGLGTTYLNTSSNQPIIGIPSGGSFSGPGIIGSNFSASIAGVGSHTISYSINVNGCIASDSQTVTVTPAPNYNYDLIISTVYDGPLTSGTPKGIELFVGQDIPDLSIYGVGSANNGGGSDGEEFTFPNVSVTAGDYIYIATESTNFSNFFGFAPDYTHGSMSINGDDAVELFQNGVVIDVFGDINTDGTNQVWEYTDGWASRNNCSQPNNGNFNNSNWTYSGINTLDGETMNSSATTPVPIGTFTCGTTCIGTTGLDIQSACGSYTWIDGNTYTTSNSTATHTLTNAAGCDSIITLNLTINNTTTATDIQSACGSFTWIDGNTYTTSNNTATHTLTNAAGCDSIITLNLTINNTTTATDIQSACGSFTWIDGNTFTTSNNTATHTLTNAAGCDSIITLNLTINNTTATDIQSACGSFTWIDGNTYTTSNNTAT